MADSTVRVIFLGDAASAVRSVNALEGRMGSLGGTAARTGKILAGAVGVALIGGMAKATSLAIGFDRSMRNVNSIAKVNEATFQRLEKRVLALSKATGQGPKVLADGLYDIVSSGFKANEAIRVLAVSAKAATAGMTDTATASKAVVAVLNAYHLGAGQAKQVSDVLFQTVNKGVLTFSELSQQIGDVLPYASKLNVPLTDIGGALATITLHGVNAAEAATQLKQVMASVIAPSKDLKKEFHDLGYESGQSALKALGFQGVIRKLSTESKGNAQTLHDWFPNIRALSGFFGISGKNAKQLADNIRSMTGASKGAGATNKAFAEQGKSISVQWDKAMGGLAAAGVKLGTTLFPALSTGIGYLSRFAGWLDKLAGQHTIRAKLEFIEAGASGVAGWFRDVLLGKTSIKPVRIPAQLALASGTGLGGETVRTQGLVQQLATAVTKGIEEVDWSSAGRSISTRISEAADKHSKDANWAAVVKKFVRDIIPAMDSFATDLERGAGQIVGKAFRSMVVKAMHLSPGDVAAAGVGTAQLIMRTISFPFRLGAAALRGVIEGTIGNSLDGAGPAVISAAKGLAHKLVNGIKEAPGYLVGLAGDLGGKIGPALLQAGKDAYDWATGIGAKIAQGVLDGIGDLASAVKSRIPFIGGGQPKSPGRGARTGTAVAGKAAGDMIGRPMLAVIGEDAPRWPEWVIPSNPKYRGRALGLLSQATGALGLPGFARGGGPRNARPGMGHHYTGHQTRGRTPVQAAFGAAQKAINSLTSAQQRVSDLSRAYSQDERAQGAVTLPPLTVDVPDDPADPNGPSHQVPNPEGIAAASAQLNQLIGEKGGILQALEDERQKIEAAIEAVRKAIDDLMDAIKILNDKAKTEGKRARSEHTLATAASNSVSRKGGLQDQIATERAAKKPNKAKILQLQNAIKQAGRDHDDHESNAKDAETNQGRYQKQAGDDASKVSDLRSTLSGLLSNRHDLPFDVRDQNIDIAYLQQSLAAVQGTTGTAPGTPSVSGGATTTTAGPVSADDTSLLEGIIQRLTDALGLQQYQQGVIQSFQSGTLYVPNDMVAQLHAGESVRTAGQTSADLRSSTGGPLLVNVYLGGPLEALSDLIDVRIEASTPTIVSKIGRSADTLRRSNMLA